MSLICMRWMYILQRSLLCISNSFMIYIYVMLRLLVCVYVVSYDLVLIFGMLFAGILYLAENYTTSNEIIRVLSQASVSCMLTLVLRPRSAHSAQPTPHSPHCTAHIAWQHSDACLYLVILSSWPFDCLCGHCDWRIWNRAPCTGNAWWDLCSGCGFASIQDSDTHVSRLLSLQVIAVTMSICLLTACVSVSPAGVQG